MKRRLRVVLLALVACIVVLIGVVGVLIARFDPNEWKPRIVAKVREATGRDLSLNGRIGVKLSLSPAIEIEDVALANPPGFSRPAMATLQRLDLELALIPLLSGRVEIRHLRAVRPDIQLETDAKGRTNWEFAAEKPTEPTTGPAVAGEKRAPISLAIEDMSIEDGAIAWRDGKTGQTTAVTIRRLSGHAASPAAPMHLAGELVFKDLPFKFVADTGSLARALDRTAATPWPIKLELESGAAKLSVEGVFTQPARGRGYRLTVNGTVPDLAQLAPLLPAGGAPPVRDMEFGLAVTDRDSAMPEISAVRVRAGRIDLASFRQGLTLDSVEIEAPGLKQPIKATVQALGATVGLRATLGEITGKSVVLKDIAIASPDGDLAGELAINAAIPATVTAVLRSERMDLDAIFARIPKQAAPTAPVGAPASAPESKRLFSDAPIPFGMLQRANADVRLTIGALRLGQVEYRAVAAHLLLREGKLTLDPVAAEVPGGTFNARLTVDAGQQAAPVGLFVRASKIALRPLLSALSQPPLADGDLEVYADLQGAGETPHAIAASLHGTLGVALANGSMDGKALGPIFARPGGKFEALNLAGRGGVNAVRCFASRFQFDKGVGTSRALVLSSALLTMRGGGRIDLGAETVDLQVTSQGRVGNSGIVLPLKIVGPMGGPAVSVDTIASTENNSRTIAGLIIGNTAQLGEMGVYGGGDICSGPLAIARGEPPPPESPPPESPPSKDPPSLGGAGQPPGAKPLNPADLLRQLLR